MQSLMQTLEFGGQTPTTMWSQGGAASVERLNGIRILLVDDNILCLTAGAQQLRRQGAEVVACSSAYAAVSAVQNAAPDHFDVVLMDLNMPGMDGMQATKLILGLEGCQSLPVIAATANEPMLYEHLARAAGMVGYVVKPYSTASISAAIHTALDLREEPVAALD